MAASLPRVYAETEVLRYVHTIRLSADGSSAGTECLMERTGLTCVNYQTRVGLQLSRENFTPLVGTDALSPDLRPEA